MSAFIAALWGLATLLQAGAVGALFRRRIARSNAALVFFLGFGFLWALVGFWFLWHGGAAYKRAWYKTQWITYVLHAILAIGAVERMARCFPKVYQLAKLMLVFFGGFAALGVLVSVGLMPKDPMPFEAALYCARHSEAAWLCFLAAALLFFAQFGGRGGSSASPNAQNGAAVAMVYFMVTFAAQTVLANAQRESWFLPVGHIALQLGCAACNLAWWVFMTSGGEVIPPPSNLSEEELGEAARQKEQLRRKLKDEGLFIIEVQGR